MDARSGGAATLLGALNDACEDFQRYGQQVAAAHGPGIHWELIGRIGPGEAPFALVGVVLRYDRTTVDLGVDLWVREGAFEVSGYGTVDGRRLLDRPARRADRGSGRGDRRAPGVHPAPVLLRNVLDEVA